MNIKEFVKAELSGWSKIEQYMIPILLIIVVSLSLYSHDSRLATFQAIFGILATIIAGKGKISSYFFGIVSVVLYSCLAWKNALYGSLLLHACYYFPMEFVGIFAWKKHLKEDSKEIYKTMLSNKERFVYSLITVFLAIFLGFILKHFNDTFPFIDAFVTIISVLALYLTVKRCIEQWVCWTIVNFLSVMMWFMLWRAGENALATMLTWSVYFCLGIYFLFTWKKEICTK